MAGGTMPSRPAIRLLLAAAAALAITFPALAQDGSWAEDPSQGGQGGYGVQVGVDGASTATLETFQSGLSPYGEWVRTGSYGTAWRPRVASGWRPYYYGRWEWTNEGWLWVSEEPFGWATYHYGRWAWDGGQGWVWVPGYQWAPAWVSWRYGGDVVGWAPLAPGLSLYVTNYAFVDFWWTFVPSVRFCGTPVWGVAYAPSRANQFYGLTSPAPPRPRASPMGHWPGGGGSARPPPPGTRPTPGWGGPPPRFIEERTGRSISASRIVAEPRPGVARGRPGEIGVYRPESVPRTGSAMRPVPGERPMSRPAMPAVPPGRPGPGAPRSPSGWDRSAPPALRGQPPQAAPRPEGRQGAGPRGGALPYRGATPAGGPSMRGGGAPRNR
jgi:hypothetical protein